MRVHFEDIADLDEVDVFAESECDDLVECCEQVERVGKDFAFFDIATGIADDAGNQMKSVDVLKNVGCFVGDEKNEGVLEWLVHVADLCSLYAGVLRTGRDQGRK